jgi:hypothetical protein
VIRSRAASLSRRQSGVFAGIVVATALMLAINGVLALIDGRVNGWRPVERDMVI